MPANDPIEHVVVLMLENHSFDQMLGCMKEIYPGLEGVNVAMGPVHSQRDYPDGTHTIPQSNTDERALAPDPMHEYVNVLRQLDPNFGYVVDYAQAYPAAGEEQKDEVMGVYPRGFFPVLHTLAENFAICDHWYSSLPGPTWPNRFFIHSGTANGHVTMPSGVFDKQWHLYDQITVFDRLEEKTISWKVYHHGMPQSLALTHQLDHPLNYHEMPDFFTDAAGPAANFPQYSFIEPCYSGSDQNDQHPPSDIMRGEVLLASVYNALRGNPDLWNRTLFLFLYDEHGGFYDHLVPPAATPPDDKTSEYAFDQYGVRVPAVLISPWIEKGFIATPFDHTSLLAYLTDKWELGPLGARTASAAHFDSALATLSAPRTDAPPPFDLSQLPQAQPNSDPRINEHQKALISFSHSLEEHIADPLEQVGDRAMRLLQGPAAQFKVALERFSRFFTKGKATP